MARSFAVRGVVEGFYGAPWSHRARLDALDFLAPRGLNAYVYAPKDDAKHRSQWRIPYDDAELARFRELAVRADQLSVAFGLGISPGLDVAYDSPADRAALLEKVRPLVDAGVPWLLLLLDDIPLRDGLARAQASLTTWFAAALRTLRRDVRVTVCPTEYVGTRPSPYLAELADGLPDDVDIMWTGPTVCSPTITADDAKSWAKAVGGRRVVVWDNYPVNDALMTNSLHLGPYVGRDAALVEVVTGVLCNPMTQAHASRVALATAMDFLGDPDGYDAGESWRRAIDDVGGSRATALATLARACADSPLALPATLELAGLVDALEDALVGPDWIAAVAPLAAELRAARALPEAFASGSDEDGGEAALAADVAPWAQAARLAAEAGLAALRLVQQVRPVATVDDGGRGRVEAPDAERAMHAAFLVMFSWSGARADGSVVYGPRFAMYSPVVQLPDGRPALDVRAAVREDANVIDRLCRLSLATYAVWCDEFDAPVRVVVDGVERPVAADGSFSAGGGDVVVSAGSVATRVVPRAALAFRDPRLS
jgi:hyaluronoglucosaminidase